MGINKVALCYEKMGKFNMGWIGDCPITATVWGQIFKKGAKPFTAVEKPPEYISL